MSVTFYNTILNYMLLLKNCSVKKVTHASFGFGKAKITVSFVFNLV